LDSNQSGTKEEFEYHRKELEGKANPIITKMYQASGTPEGFPASGPTPGEKPGGSASGGGAAKGPKIEEVD